MVNLSNVTHNCVWSRPIEQVASTTSSMVETYTNASMGVEGLLYGRRNCKTIYNKISI
jgi:hypothetical protein